MTAPNWEAEARKLIRIEKDPDGRPLYYAWLGEKLLEGNEYESALEGVRDDIAPTLAKALRAAYDKGREDAKPKRVELGCDSPSCFCTGRCKRTAEEQEAYEKREREGWGLKR